MSSELTKKTEVVLSHHLQSVFDENIDAIMSDYVEDSALFLPQGPVQGLSQLRRFFDEFLANKPESFAENFQMIRQDVAGDFAYIVWKSDPSIPLATDTYVIRDGKIVIQTFAAYMTPRDG